MLKAWTKLDKLKVKLYQTNNWQSHQTRPGISSFSNVILITLTDQWSVTRSKSQRAQLFIFPKTHSLLVWRLTDHENVIHSIQTFYCRFCPVHCQLPNKEITFHNVCFVEAAPKGKFDGNVYNMNSTPHSTLCTIHYLSIGCRVRSLDRWLLAGKREACNVRSWKVNQKVL